MQWSLLSETFFLFFSFMSGVFLRPGGGREDAHVADDRQRGLMRCRDLCMPKR